MELGKSFIMENKNERVQGKRILTFLLEILIEEKKKNV